MKGSKARGIQIPPPSESLLKTCLFNQPAVGSTWRLRPYYKRNLNILDHPLTKLFLPDSFSPVFLVINPQATTILAIVILFLLIISFVLAGSEVAFFSLTYKDINILKNKQDNSWKRIV